MSSTPTRKIVVFSGGSAANSLVDVFNQVIENNSCSLSYVIPVSDNGGSSSELIRVFGGPAIGDIRSMIIVFSIVLDECSLGFAFPHVFLACCHYDSFLFLFKMSSVFKS